MNISAIDARTTPRLPSCAMAAWPRQVVSLMFAVSIAALEAWLRVPLQPVLDVCLKTATSSASSICAAIFPTARSEFSRQE